MLRRLTGSIFAVVLTLGIGNVAVFAAPARDETQKPAVERKLDAKTLASAGEKMELPVFEKSTMAEYEREKAKARRMSTGKKVAIIGGIAAAVIVVAAIAVKNTEIRTF